MAIWRDTTTFSTCFSTFLSGHSLHLCPFSLHLKHSNFTTFCLFIVLSSTPHCITLLNNTSNLFWGVILPLSSPFSKFLQFWARCPNFQQLKHSFSFLSSSSSLSLMREYFCLSILLRIELYYSKDIVLYFWKWYRFNGLSYLILCLLECKIFIWPDVYYLTNYCPI